MRFTGHAIDRCTEFGLTLDVVERIVRQPSVSRSAAQGRTISVSELEPLWAVVTAPDGVVLTVLQRTGERWEHQAGQASTRTRGIIDTDAYLDMEPVAQPTPMVAKRTAKAKASRPRVAAVKGVIDPRAITAARRLARGDLARLVMAPDTGVVYVANSPAAARRFGLA